MISEHIAFVRADGIESGHLLPLPRTREALDVLVENTREAMDALPVPLALENIASLVRWPRPELDEAEFLTDLVERTGVGLWLHLANVHANSRNDRDDPLDLMDRIPLEALAYVHVAGGIEGAGLYHDTHTAPVSRDVLVLVEQLAARTTIPGILLERDDQFPSAEEFTAELDAIVAAAERGKPDACPVRGVSMTGEARRNQAELQASLLRSLTGSGQVPEGIDLDRVAAARTSLAVKRSAALPWPGPTWPRCSGAISTPGSPSSPLKHASPPAAVHSLTVWVSLAVSPAGVRCPPLPAWSNSPYRCGSVRVPTGLSPAKAAKWAWIDPPGQLVIAVRWLRRREFWLRLPGRWISHGRRRNANVTG